MFSHIMVGTNDLEQSRQFYDATMAELGYKPGILDDDRRYFYVSPSGITFCVTKPIDNQPATVSNGSTIGLGAKSAEAVDAWHAAGVANGGTAIEAPPGIRSGNSRELYLAYLRDPTGNKLCALYRPQKP